MKAEWRTKLESTCLIQTNLLASVLWTIRYWKWALLGDPRNIGTLREVKGKEPTFLETTQVWNNRIFCILLKWVIRAETQGLSSYLWRHMRRDKEVSPFFRILLYPRLSKIACSATSILTPASSWCDSFRSPLPLTIMGREKKIPPALYEKREWESSVILSSCTP